jgi:hypothetical protein
LGVPQGKMRLAPLRLAVKIAMGDADYYGPAYHEVASKFVGQIYFRLNIQQPDPVRLY